MRRHVAVLVLLGAVLSVGLGACGGREVSTSPAVAPPPPAPRLVVLLVVDGLPSWSFEAKMRDARAGFARLAREGVVYRSAAYPYSATYTAPGHAALVTGVPPRVTGIVANRWFDPVAMREVDAAGGPEDPVLDILEPSDSSPSPTPSSPPSAPPSPPASASRGGSPRMLLVDSVGDVLRRSTGGRGRVVSASVKRHASVLLGGRRPNAAIWFDEAQVAFSTSRYYGTVAPTWLRSLAARQPIAPRLASYEWVAADPAHLAAVTSLADAAPGELGIFGHGPVFPHRPGGAARPAQAIQATPLADELLLEAVMAAVDGEGLGRDEAPDLLCVSFSAHDIVGHGWGQESWESLDEFIRLDRVIGALLDGLDARVGRGRWALVFSSDHGATRVVEQSVAAGRAALRIDPEELGRAADAIAQRVVGRGDLIADSREQLLYLAPAARALPPEEQGRLLDAIAAGLRATPGIDLVFRTDSMPASCETLPARDALACRSVYPGRSGDIYFTPRADSVLMPRPWDTSTHGSASDDDRRVPIIVLEPGAAARTEDRPVSTLQVAPTLARLLRVAFPAREPGL